MALGVVCTAAVGAATAAFLTEDVRVSIAVVAGVAAAPIY